MRILLLLLFVSSVVFGQTDAQKAYLSENDHAALVRLSNAFEVTYAQQQQRVADYLAIHRGISKRQEVDGVLMEMYDVLDGVPQYYQTHNLNSSKTIRADHLYNGGSLGLDVQGQNMTVGVWDGGAVRNTHQEFQGRVTLADNGTIDDHGTHVAGTIVAGGVNPNLRGIAFQANALSYDWNNDLNEMVAAASNGLLVSNHSYGQALSDNGAWMFGAYTAKTRDMDNIAFNAPFYTIVQAAGNSRNQTSHPVIGPHLNFWGGHETIITWNTAKNSITVGAVSNVSNYTGSNSVNMSAFSSWGPTDDGRIKPDIVAMGVSVHSPTAGSDGSSQPNNGTSMASPAVAGAAILLQQHYHNTFSSYMRSATLKGLMLHTADEAGANVGPDYRFGWGLLNTRRAAEIITAKTIDQAVIEEVLLQNGENYALSVSASGSEPLMISISWTDPGATNVNNGTENPGQFYLVNDLDVRAVKDGQTFFPWTLQPFMPDMAASRNFDNNRDNYEKIQIDNPNGVYQINVTHKGSLVGGQQRFSIIVTGSNATLSTQDLALQDFTIYPNPTTDQLQLHLGVYDAQAQFEIIDVQGRSIRQQNFSGDQTTIGVSDLLSGVYFLRVTSQGQVSTKKFIKK